MTQIVGNVLDVSGGGLTGSVTVWSGFRPEVSSLIAPRRRRWDITNGELPADMHILPGPVVVELNLGLNAFTSFEAVVPDQETVRLKDLFSQGYVWHPFVISEVSEYKNLAEAAADRAESASDRAESAANEFGLTATATTGAAGSNAAVTVTGDGPAYGLALTVPRGDKGERGERGPQGDQGPQGDTGEQGIQGPKGDKGDTGEQGEQGVQGPKGDKGDTGDRGLQGEQGVQGIQGEQGPRGLQGEKGEQGDTGPKGDRGDDGEVSQAALDAAVATLVDGAPEALDTLTELAAALGNDPNFATTVSTEIGLRAKTADVSTALAGKADSGAETTATWAGVSGKPATFPPTTGSTAATAKPGNYVPAWSEVTGKPTTFTPASHSHAWAEVTGKPTTFAPSAHTHTWSQISDAPAYSKDTTGDTLVQRGSNGHINVPSGAGALNAIRRSEVDAAINAKIQLVADFPASPVAGVLYLKAE